MMLLFSLSAYAMTAKGGLPFTLTPNTNGYGSVSLDWRQYNYSNKNFKVYKSSDGGRTYEGYYKYIQLMQQLVSLRYGWKIMDMAKELLK